MAKMMPTASAFSNDVWMRAVLAHVPGTAPIANDKTDGPFRHIAAKCHRLPFAHLQSTSTALTPCPLPSVTCMPTASEAKTFLNGIAMPLVLRGVPVDHPVTAILLKTATNTRVLKTWVRAALEVTGTFDSWMMENFDHKRRKELKRLKTRLAEQGCLELAELAPGANLEPHISAFLRIESSGWKGERGTAVNSDPRAAKGLVAGLTAMHAENKVRFWTLRLDGKPVASLFALVDGGSAVLGKIGYDETFAKYSPGVLLIIEATRCLFADRAVNFADANAIPDHPMIDRIWRNRMACMDVVIAGSAVSTLIFQTVAAYHGMKDVARTTAKNFYLNFTGRKQS